MFDWAEYLDVADDLIVLVGGEGGERSAISRAYYACYGKASAYAKSKRVPLTGRGSDHHVVWQWFIDGLGRGPIHVSVGQNGQRLKGWRIKADYRAGFSNTGPISQNAIAVARQLLDDLSTLP